MEIWEPEGVFGDSRLIWMITEGMESGVWMVVSGTIVFGACGLVRGCECCTMLQVVNISGKSVACHLLTKER